MNKKFLSALCVSLLFSGLSVTAENWIKSTDDSPAWVDTDSYKKNGNISSLDMRLGFPEGTILSTLEFNTRSSTWRTASLVTRDNTGKVLHAEQKTDPAEGWNRIMPGTYGKSIYTHYIQTPIPHAEDFEWLPVYQEPTKQYAGSTFSIDKKTLSYKDGYADFWLDASFPQEKKDFSRTIYRVKMNMAYKKVMTISATEYNYAGKIRLHAAGSKKWEEIPSNTPIEKVFNYLKEEIDSGRLK